jgi:hypothetical protein
LTHRVAVAVAVADIGMPPAVVCAALLHDVIEDTPCPPGDDRPAEAPQSLSPRRRPPFTLMSTHAGLCRFPVNCKPSTVAGSAALEWFHERN